LAEKGYIRSYVSASAVTDIFYILKKELGDVGRAFELLENILKITRVASVTEGDIHEALDLRWSDFEDSVQYVAGRGILADYIITRNPRDFSDSRIEVVLPGMFLQRIFE